MPCHCGYLCIKKKTTLLTNDKQLLDEVFDRDLDYSGYHKNRI